MSDYGDYRRNDTTNSIIAATNVNKSRGKHQVFTILGLLHDKNEYATDERIAQYAQTLGYHMADSSPRKRRLDLQREGFIEVKEPDGIHRAGSSKAGNPATLYGLTKKGIEEWELQHASNKPTGR